MAQRGQKSTTLKGDFLPVLVMILGVGVPLGFAQHPDWQMIHIGDLFSFRLPEGWTKRSSIDGRGEWAKGDSKLVYVWGQSDSGKYGERRQSWMNDYEETTTRLGGRRANIRSFSKVMGGRRVYKAELNVGNWEQGEVQLFMRVEGSDAATIALAKEIFKSVRLPLPSPERTVPQ